MRSYGSAIRQALRGGEFLLAAKSEVKHGAWTTWVENNFLGSERTAQGCIRIAREGDPQRLAHLPVREALATLAVPRAPAGGEAAEVIDAELAADEPRPSVFDLLRKAGGLEQ